MFEGPGPLVKAWRLQYAHCRDRSVTQADVARVLDVNVSSFKAFEEGRRPLSKSAQEGFLGVVAKLDAHFEAGHVLYDLIAALDTPRVFTVPRSEWRHNFSSDEQDARPVFAQHVGRPAQPATQPPWQMRGSVWAWIRPAGELEDGDLKKVRGQVKWGPLTLQVDAECGRDGVFVSCPTSSPHPAARVQLDEPGWVDFGRGELPPAWMGGSNQSGLVLRRMNATRVVCAPSTRRSLHALQGRADQP